MKIHEFQTSLYWIAIGASDGFSLGFTANFVGKNYAVVRSVHRDILPFCHSRLLFVLLSSG
tara:strand:+ start:944 stop:1126 length:183 start_codon:yes stop_codon:yes gene_type:complete